MNEFSLIDDYFKPLGFRRPDVLLGIGDDAACLSVGQGMSLIVSTDTLVANVHFLPHWEAYDIAYRSVMVSVSDLAAMGAQPCWATLALTLPEVNGHWLESFAKGLKAALQPYNISLIGGDTTKGPLSITLTVFGQLPQGKEIRRQGAQPGDLIVVSGQLGAAALAVQLLDAPEVTSNDHETLMQHLLHPQARIDLIELLRTYASAAIDISDGLSADLNHICVASHVGVCLDLHALPLHPLLNKYRPQEAVDLALSGGDDYELCFTVPAAKIEACLAAMKAAGQVCYPIGVIEAKPGMRIKLAENQFESLTPRGYSHF